MLPAARQRPGKPWQLPALAVFVNDACPSSALSQSFLQQGGLDIVGLLRSRLERVSRQLQSSRVLVALVVLLPLLLCVKQC